MSEPGFTKETLMEFTLHVATKILSGFLRMAIIFGLVIGGLLACVWGWENHPRVMIWGLLLLGAYGIGDSWVR